MPRGVGGVYTTVNAMYGNRGFMETPFKDFAVQIANTCCIWRSHCHHSKSAQRAAGNLISSWLVREEVERAIPTKSAKISKSRLRNLLLNKELPFALCLFRALEKIEYHAALQNGSLWCSVGSRDSCGGMLDVRCYVRREAVGAAEWWW